MAAVTDSRSSLAQAPTDDEEASWGRYSHREILVIYSGLMLGMLLGALDQTVVATALPTIVGQLGGLEQLAWVVTAYMLTSTATTLLYGKLGDLFGRKKIFQLAIFIFLVGSVCSGLSQNMVQLIASRALQGAGAGGLMALAMTIIADVVSPRERGRYQGYSTGVFAVASIVGPLIGGLFTDHLTWRWVFFVNVPIGIAALFMASVALQETTRRVRHTIDYLGSVLMMAGVTALLLVLTWGGTQYAWSSVEVLGTAAAAVVCLVAFAVWEMHVSEPILPLTLFSNSIFTITTLVALISGMSMFGAVVFLPVFLQLVSGTSATNSGLLLTPQMAGVIITSITAGRLITRTGKYKIFPLIGIPMQLVAFFLMSGMNRATSQPQVAGFMVLLGLGMGMTMPTLTTAMQNAVSVRVMGVATSVSQFARSMGSALGVTVFGAIMNNRLAYYLPRALPPGSLKNGLGASSLEGSPRQILALPYPVRLAIIDSFARALHVVFIAVIPVIAVSLVLTVFLKELPLRSGSRRSAAEEGVELMDLGALAG
ncbi:MAG TPA: MDR family MFS transporter [Chloroflexota bacterium]|nr:MDR family MFS transporter [Chloroflexota bacterium]